MAEGRWFHARNGSRTAERSSCGANAKDSRFKVVDGEELEEEAAEADEA